MLNTAMYDAFKLKKYACCNSEEFLNEPAWDIWFVFKA